MPKRSYANSGIPMGRAGGSGYRRTFKRPRSSAMVVPYRSRGYLRTGGNYGRYGASNRAAGHELKWFDVPETVVPVTVGGVIAENSFCEMAQGVGENERLGRKCTIKQLHITGTCTLATPTSTSDTDDIVRVMVIQDKQTNGSAENITDVLEYTGYQSFRNLSNSSRYRVLGEKIMAMNAVGGANVAAGYAGASVNKTFKFNLSKLWVTMEYDGATGAVSEMRTNNIFLLAISKSGLCSIVCQSRCRFADN